MGPNTWVELENRPAFFLGPFTDLPILIPMSWEDWPIKWKAVRGDWPLAGLHPEHELFASVLSKISIS